MSRGQTDRRRHGGRPHHVGRVGALALFLGVGAVITPLPASAVADTGSPADTTATAGTADSSGPATPRHSRGGRGVGAGRDVGTPPAPAADRRASRRSKNPTAAAGAESARPGRAGIATPVAVPGNPGEALAPAGGESVKTAAGKGFAAPVADAPMPSSQASAVRITSSAVPSAASAPEMAAAVARGAVVAADPSDWLGGGRDPLAPIAVPIGWATLAVSRRELSPAASAPAPAASVSAAEPAPSPLTDALARPGARDALAGAAKQFVLTVAGGGSTVAALQSGISSLENNPIFSDITLDSLLTDPALPQAAGSATGAVVGALAADPEVRAAVGQAISIYLAPALGGLPASIAPSVAGAAVALLADPAAGRALGSVAGTMVEVFLGHPGVVPGLTAAAYQLQGALNGEGFGASLDSAWESVQGVSAVRDGIVGAVAAGVNTALSDPGLVAALGTAASSLVGDLSADPSTWTLAGDLLGSGYGDAVVGLLSNPATLAQTAGAALTGFLGQPGVAAALSVAVGDLADALLTGADPTAAATQVFDRLQGDPAVAQALSAAASAALRAILGDPGVQEAVGGAAEEVVASLVAGAADAAGLSPVVTGLVSVAVDSLLGDTAVQGLISDIVPAIVGADSSTDLAGVVVQAVIDRPALQTAVGTAVGAAVGSLIGDNPIGKFVAQAVAKGVTALIRAVIRFAPLLTGLGITLPGPAAAENRSGSGYLLAVAL